MDPHTLPSVTCVITAYNQERFIVEAVDSALAQDYPPELLDVVVVNDGSSDATAAILRQQFGSEPRVQIIDQENRGFVAAMNVAIGAATGELIGVLDGDDAWPADRLRRQVPLLVARPEVGLVHGDMEVIDTHGRTLHPSFFAYSQFELARGRVLAKLIRQNFIAGGATLVRASLRPHFHPIPEELLYPDWYIAAQVAERAEIDHVDASVNRYRMHGSNMGLGGTGRKFFSDMRNNVRIQRWMLAHLDTTAEPLTELARAAETMITNATRAALELEARPSDILPVTETERAASLAAEAAATEAWNASRLDQAGHLYVDALADDPWNGSARAGLLVAHARTERQAEGAPTSDPLPTRAAAVIAFADELLATPEMLRVYGESLDGSDDATLLIHSPVAAAAAQGAALGEALAAAGLDGPDAADMLLYPCEDVAELLAAPVRAIYTRRGKPPALTTLPRVDDSSLERLRSLLAA